MLTCLLMYCVLCVLFMTLCKGPDDQIWAHILMVPLGFVMGALYAAQRTHFAAFVPGGVSLFSRVHSSTNTDFDTRALRHTGFDSYLSANLPPLSSFNSEKQK